MLRLILAFAILGLLGCASASPAPTSKPTSIAATLDKGAIRGYQVVMAATRIDGVPMQQEARPTALVFFASWCGPCRSELADLGDIRQRYPSLRIVGLNAYEEYRDYSDQERLRIFLQEHAPWMTEVVSADPLMLSDFGNVPRIPTLFVYDAKGGVVAEYRRDQRAPPSHAELEAAIAAAVRGSR